MFIDLSVSLNEKTPVYPGDEKTKIKAIAILEKNGYQDHYLCISTHVGTHMDAPAHMIPNGKNIGEISLEKFSGHGVYIKVSNQKFDLAEIEKIPIAEGDIVFFHTSMSEQYYLPEYFKNYPAIPESVADYLIKKKIKIVGVDACSPDYAPFAVHKMFLQEGILIIENLTNLTLLAGKKFKVYAFPLNIALDGSPVRVIAEIIS